MEKKIRADFAACFYDFLEDRASEAKAKIAEVTGARKRLLERWFSKEELPIGRHLLCIKFLLYSQGYEVVELEQLHPIISQYGQLIYKKAFTWKEGHKQLSITSDNFARIMRGVRSFSKKTWGVKMERICNRYGVEIEPTTALAEIVSAVNAVVSEDLLKQLIIGQIKLLRPLIQIAISELSAEGRADIRKAIGDGVGKESFFDFSNSVNALCGEDARQIYLNG